MEELILFPKLKRFDVSVKTLGCWLVLEVAHLDGRIMYMCRDKL